jgi:hypothetical protein
MAKFNAGRIGALTLLILFFAVRSRADDKLRFSIVGAYSQSRVVIEGAQASSQFAAGDTQSYASYNVGVLFEKPLKNLWSLEVGAFYLTRGYAYESEIFDGRGTTVSKSKISWKNIYIPFVGRFRPTKIFTGLIGLFASQGFGKVTSEFEFAGTSNKDEATFSDAGLTTLDYGITYGAGLNFQVSPSTELLIELRFDEGLKNIADAPPSSSGGTGKATTRDIMLLLGFII